jgi:hypothetical protein
MNDLKTWLDNPSAPFPEGVALHKKYGRDKELQAFVERYEDDPAPIAAILLRRELARVYRIAANSKPAIPAPPQPAPLSGGSEAHVKKKIMIVDTLDIDYSRLSPELQAKYRDIQATWKEMCVLHDGLKHAKTDEERAPAVEKLKTLEDTNAARWADIYEWADANAAGKELTPEQKVNPELAGILKERRRRNLAIYIARDQKKLPGETDPVAREKSEARIASWQKELDALQ